MTVYDYLRIAQRSSVVSVRPAVMSILLFGLVAPSRRPARKTTFNDVNCRFLGDDDCTTSKGPLKFIEPWQEPHTTGGQRGGGEPRAHNHSHAFGRRDERLRGTTRTLRREATYEKRGTQTSRVGRQTTATTSYCTRKKCPTGPLRTLTQALLLLPGWSVRGECS